MSDPYPFWKSMSPDYKKLNTKLRGLPSALLASSPEKVETSSDPASYGAAGLAPALPALASPLIGAAGAVVGSALPPLAAAYGIGKLVAPEATDRAVGKIKDLWNEKIMPFIKRAQGVGSGYVTGMASAIPGSKLIEKALPQKARDLIGSVREQNPEAVTAGKVAGNVGLMALPGANVVKGAGLLGTAANAAINAAPFALGTGLDVGATTGNVGKGVGAGLGSLALGTAIPSAVSGLAKVPAVNRFLAKLQLAAAGIRGGDLQKITRTWAKSLGMRGGAIDTYAMQHADEIVNQAADLVGKYGAGRGGKEAIKKLSTEGFEAHAKLWDSGTGKKFGKDDIAAVFDDSDLEQLRARFGDRLVKKTVNQIGKEINGQGWTDARRVLSEYEKAGNKFQGLSPKDPKILDSAISDIMRDHLDIVADGFMKGAKEGKLGINTMNSVKDIPSLHVLKATYPATLAMTKAGAREAGNISGRFAGGSDTAVRQLLTAAPYLVGGGVVAPGAVGDMIRNPENIPLDLLKIGVGSVGGRLLTRGAGRSAEIGTGALAGSIRKAGEVPSAALGRMLGKAGEVMATEEEPAPASVDTIPQPDIIQPKMIGSVAPTGTPEAIQQKEAALDEGAIQDARAKTLSAYETRIQKVIENEYKLNLAPYGVEYKDFLDAVMSRIGDSQGGIDPKLAAPILFPDKDQRTKFLRDYDKALALKGIDVGAALGYGAAIGQGGLAQARAEGAGSAGAMKSKKSYEDLIGLLSNLAPTVDKSSDKQRDAQVRQDIATIKKMAGSGAQKKAMIEELIQNRYGVDLAQLKGLGLYA